MSKHSLMIWILSFWCSSRLVLGQLPTESLAVPLTFAAMPASEVYYLLPVFFEGTESALIYRVSAGLSMESSNGRFLAMSGTSVAFDQGALVSSNALGYANPTSGYGYVISLHAYDWMVRFPGNQMFVLPLEEYFPQQKTILIGFERQHPIFTGKQYGWVRLERETADTKNAFRPDGTTKQITFMPTAFAVNPIPDQPIRAGEPPDLPQLVTEVLAPEEGLPTRVRVSWAAGWANMRLESAVELGNPVQWSPVFEVTGTEAVFELPEDGQLYLRLAYVP
jgi:hypothetical protein